MCNTNLNPVYSIYESDAREHSKKKNIVNTKEIKEMAKITEEYVGMIEEALKDEAFAEKITSQTSVEEIKNLFATKNIELDDEIAEAAISKLDSYKESGELTEDDLEMVSGGAFWSTVKGCAVGGALVYFGVTTAPVAICVGGAIAIYGIVKKG